MDANAYAARAFEQLIAGEFLVGSHAYNIVRMRERSLELEAAYARYAPRYDSDDEFDVRTIMRARR
jgi:hypothetical protein